MRQRPIMDAGPGLNFLSLHKERLLFSVLGPLCVPEAVQTEILRKAGQDQRFAAAASVWAKLPEHLMEVLSDDITDELLAAVQRISGLPLPERRQISRDLGETMVVAHAAIAAEAGNDVFVLIDDGAGCQLAAAEARRLQRRQARGETVGGISLIHTVTVLQLAAGGEHLPDKDSTRNLYGKLRNLDDGLPPLEHTNLMNLACWRK
jgi:hypothetical protein